MDISDAIIDKYRLSEGKGATDYYIKCEILKVYNQVAPKLFTDAFFVYYINNKDIKLKDLLKLKPIFEKFFKLRNIIGLNNETRLTIVLRETGLNKPLKELTVEEVEKVTLLMDNINSGFPGATLTPYFTNEEVWLYNIVKFNQIEPFNKGTSWCTTSIENFRRYIANGPILRIVSRKQDSYLQRYGLSTDVKNEVSIRRCNNEGVSYLEFAQTFKTYKDIFKKVLAIYSKEKALGLSRFLDIDMDIDTYVFSNKTRLGSFGNPDTYWINKKNNKLYVNKFLEAEMTPSSLENIKFVLRGVYSEELLNGFRQIKIIDKKLRIIIKCKASNYNLLFFYYRNQTKDFICIDFNELVKRERFEIIKKITRRYSKELKLVIKDGVEYSVGFVEAIGNTYKIKDGVLAYLKQYSQKSPYFLVLRGNYYFYVPLIELVKEKGEGIFKDIYKLDVKHKENWDYKALRTFFSMCGDERTPNEKTQLFKIIKSKKKILCMPHILLDYDKLLVINNSYGKRYYRIKNDSIYYLGDDTLVSEMYIGNIKSFLKRTGINYHIWGNLYVRYKGDEETIKFYNINSKGYFKTVSFSELKPGSGTGFYKRIKSYFKKHFNKEVFYVHQLGELCIFDEKTIHYIFDGSVVENTFKIIKVKGFKGEDKYYRISGKDIYYLSGGRIELSRIGIEEEAIIKSGIFEKINNDFYIQKRNDNTLYFLVREGTVNDFYSYSPIMLDARYNLFYGDNKNIKDALKKAGCTEFSRLVIQQDITLGAMRFRYNVTIGDYHFKSFEENNVFVESWIKQNLSNEEAMETTNITHPFSNQLIHNEHTYNYKITCDVQNSNCYWKPHLVMILKGGIRLDTYI